MGREIAFSEGDEINVGCYNYYNMHLTHDDRYIFTYDFICIASLRLGQERSFGG